MRQLNLTFLFLMSLFFHPAFAQETILKGYLGVEGGEAYTYKLVFTDSAGYLKGHSYTYLYETKEVKATITGFIDRNNKTLAFKETSIVYNHGFESGTTICLINAVLKHKMGNDGKEIYSGAITSSDIGNVYCGQGTVRLPYSEELKKVFTIAAPSEIKTANTPPRKPIKIVYDTARVQQPAKAADNAHKNEPERITFGTEKLIEWYSDTLIIEIWDGGKIDGDKISVTYEATQLVKGYALAKEHRRLISFPVKDGVSEIVFNADNEGNEQPMTAHIWLIDGAKKHELIVYNNVGRQAKIKIQKKALK